MRKSEKERLIAAAYGQLLSESYGLPTSGLIPIGENEIITIDEEMGILTPLQQQVLFLRFGLQTGRGLPCKETAIQLGLKPHNVSSIKKRALIKLWHSDVLHNYMFFISLLRDRVEYLAEKNEALTLRVADCEALIQRLRKARYDITEEAEKKAFGAYPILRTPIDECELTTRVKNSLARGSTHSLFDLVTLHERELDKFEGFGKKSLAEVKEFLSDQGLSLGMKF